MKKNEQKIADVLKDFIKSPKIEKGYSRKLIQHAWIKELGPTIASKTSKIFFSKGVLYVSISSAALRHELSISKHKIIPILNKEIGEPLIQQIVFK